MNKLDENGRRHGLWEVYHPNDRLWFKGEYIHGRAHGLWEYYWDNGKLSYKGEHKKGKDIGLWYVSRYAK